MLRIQLLFGVSLLFVSGWSSSNGIAQEPSKGIDFFEQKIRPVLAEHCYQCHSVSAEKSKKLKASLLLDTPSGLLKGGDSGPSIVPGKPTEGTLLKALHHVGEIKMPPKGKLPKNVLADFELWAKAGHLLPAVDKSPVVNKEVDWNQARQFWAFRQPTKSPVPKVQDTAWPQREIDSFILAELEKRQLKPNGLATKRELLRRAYFDLIGLPPSPEEADQFFKDESPNAYVKLIDRLLASPHYGERWARYWLDISRYAEDKALAFVNTRPHAYRYRDWVVQAFNQDMPYDQFLKLQLAGDLLPELKANPITRLAGLGFQGLGAEYHRGSVAPQVIADELDDRVDTLTRGLLGLTVACARCHDHKYDPIPTRDYYSLAAAYNGSNLVEQPLVEPSVFERFKKWEKQTKEVDATLAQWIKDQSRDVAKPAVMKTGKYLLAAWEFRAHQQLKKPLELSAIASRDQLNLLFLERVVNYLDSGKFDKLDPALLAWINDSKKANESLRLEQDKVVVPESLRKATEQLQQEIVAGLPKANTKEAPNLLKSIWLNPGSLFFVTEKELPALLSPESQQELARIKTEAEHLKKDALPAPPMAHGITGGGTALRVNIRGNVERLGEPAPPGFLRILAETDQKPTTKFTRLELANAIASPKNPLTARVIVNRVWHYHFGRGIVATPSNFGFLGDRPTHPELLDSLTVRFIENGWSIRWLHREIMLSRAYQSSSMNAPRNTEKDPENQYLWRHTPKRLDFEAWRDSWLAVAGKLDRTIGGPSIEVNQPDNGRRTLYSKISRLHPNALLVLFDFPDANVTSDRRSVTTVPQQQLFTLNSDFSIETAKAFSKRLEQHAPKEDERIRLAFRLAYARLPSTVEQQASEEFLREAKITKTTDRLTAWEQFAQAILSSNEFLWVD